MSQEFTLAAQSESTHAAAGSRHGRAAGGFSLIEVLVALVVLSVGLLGLAALQTNAVEFNHDAYLRSQATILAYDIADRIRGNRQAAIDGEYVSVFATTLPTCNAAVAGTVAQQDIGAWRRALVCALPAGNGQIDWDAAAEVLTVTVRWDKHPGAIPSQAEEFVMTTGL
jgi:type IV pilus assembly protein PilV